MATSAEQTINVPQLLLVLLLGGFAIRYFFFSAPSQSRGHGGSSSAANNVRAREADVERVQQMFPQISRRSIMWDLQRNGGNVVATTERILSGRGLEVPPQSFQPPLPVPASGSAPTSASSQPKPLQPDLITRYNLKAKLAEESSQKEEEEAAAQQDRAKKSGSKKQGQAWSQNKNERQALLQHRREEMILAARRKMEAKVAQEVGEGRLNP
ncbi:Coupling of ubiquitin conjugation to ER degradation protein 1 [Phlyctema vagabunda]|uniref:Coupling of ubiquitin conjugation to ER degradation protein 1 n=1 Tax=Phlyctema vagabunda TaxID=108571 RepID=A0ABR4P1W4_9HELO